MKVYREYAELNIPCVLALGSFDTIHVGHQSLILEAKAQAEKSNMPFGIYMFDVRPAHVLSTKTQYDVYTNEEREKILEGFGVDFIYYETFNKSFMQKTPEEFVKHLKNKLHAETVVAGFNYRFGCKATGNSDALCALCAQHEIRAVIMPAVRDEIDVISSTRIRDLLFAGEMERVNAMLGRNYSMCGTVQKDRGVGHKLGFPTANLAVEETKALPKNGVYMTVACVDGKNYPSITNVGLRPTFHLKTRTIETHLLGFVSDLYGKDICLSFYRHLRNEISFADEKALQTQILKDKADVEILFSEINLKNL